MSACLLQKPQASRQFAEADGRTDRWRTRMWCIYIIDTCRRAVRTLCKNAYDTFIAQSDWQLWCIDILTCMVHTNDAPGTPQPFEMMKVLEHLSLLSHAVSKDFFCPRLNKCIVCVRVCVRQLYLPSLWPEKASFILHHHQHSHSLSPSVRWGCFCSAGWLFDNTPVSALRIILITVFPVEENHFFFFRVTPRWNQFSKALSKLYQYIYLFFAFLVIIFIFIILVP